MTSKNSRVDFKSTVKSEYSYLDDKTRQSVFSIIGTYFTLYFINQVYGNAYNNYNKPNNTEPLNNLFKNEITTITNILKNPQFRGEFFSQSLINMQEQLRMEPHLSTISFQIFVDMIFKEICPPDYEKAVRSCDKTTMIISAIYNSFTIFMKNISKKYIDMIVFKRDDPYTLEVLRDAYNRALEQASTAMYEKIINPSPATVPIINKSIKKELDILVNDLKKATSMIKNQQQIIENSRKLICVKNTEITNLRAAIETKHDQVLSQSIEISNIKKSLNTQIHQNQDLIRSLELLKYQNHSLSTTLTKENLMSYEQNFSNRFDNNKSKESSISSIDDNMSMPVDMIIPQSSQSINNYFDNDQELNLNRDSDQDLDSSSNLDTNQDLNEINNDNNLSDNIQESELISEFTINENQNNFNSEHTQDEQLLVEDSQEIDQADDFSVESDVEY